jgi:hypothetical protein
VETTGRISPDGRWIAYVSNETGAPEVYVRTFPAPGGKWQISVNGGAQPQWRRDGKEIFYLAQDGTLTAVPVAGGADAFEAGRPVPLFQKNLNILGWRNHYTPSADGENFLVYLPAGDSVAVPMTVVVHWNPERNP